MKIVIDISEDVYTRLFDNGIQDNEISVDDVCEIARAIRLGTPLSKQEPCDDCISRQAVIEMAYDLSEIDGEHFTEPRMVVDVEDIQNAPPVAPAEKVGQLVDTEEIDILKKDLKGRQKKIEKLIVTCARYKYKADLYYELYSKMCKDNIILAGELAAYKVEEDKDDRN